MDFKFWKILKIFPIYYLHKFSSLKTSRAVAFLKIFTDFSIAFIYYLFQLYLGITDM